MLDPSDCPGLAAYGVVARTAVARAEVATVHWDGDGEPLTATARVHTDGRGCLLVLLDGGSALGAAAERHPVLTVVVPADEPWTAVRLEGVAHRVPVVRGATFRLAPAAVALVGAGRQDVPTAAYYAAEPDPGWELAPDVVDHLAATHTQELTRFLRRHGCAAAEAVVPVALSAEGLQVAVLRSTGVDALRVRFPAPVRSLPGALVALKALLACDGC